MFALHRSCRSFASSPLRAAHFYCLTLSLSLSLSLSGPLSLSCSHAFCVTGQSVVVHSVETGESLRTLTAHSDTVTSACLHPTNPMQLLTSSLDGTVRAWDFLDGVELEKWDIGKPVIDMVALEVPHAGGLSRAGQLGLVLAKRRKKKGKKKKKKKKKDKGGAAAAATAEAEAASEVYTVQLQMRWVVYDLAARSVSAVLEKNLGSWRDSKTCADSPNIVRQHSCGRFVVATTRGVAGESSVILVFDAASTDREQRVRRVSHCRRITCLAIHPAGAYVVAGDEEGQISFFHCLGAAPSRVDVARQGGSSKKRRRLSSSGGDGSSSSNASGSADSGALSKKWRALTPLERKLSEATAALHWHAFGVRCLAFSPDGAYLLSGGEEAVLVSWQLNSGERDFLPRMGSALCGIAIGGRGGSTYAVSLVRNVVLAIDAGARKVRWKIHGLELAKSARSIDDFCFQPRLFSSALSKIGAGASVSNPTTAMRTLVLDTRSPLAQGADGPLLVLNGAPGTGSIQLWGLGTGRHIDSVQAAPRNMVTVADRNKGGRSVAGRNGGHGARTKVHQLPVSMVRHACFSYDGLGLVTIDHRDIVADEWGGFSSASDAADRAPSRRREAPEELTMRFWRLGSHSRRYQLHTWVQRPHQSAITRLVYHPTRHIVVTTSCDRSFKLWHRVNFGDGDALRVKKKDSGSDAPQYAWVCRSIGSFRDATVRFVSFLISLPLLHELALRCVKKKPISLVRADPLLLFSPPALAPPSHDSPAPAPRPCSPPTRASLRMDRCSSSRSAPS